MYFGSQNCFLYLCTTTTLITSLNCFHQNFKGSFTFPRNNSTNFQNINKCIIRHRASRKGNVHTVTHSETQTERDRMTDTGTYRDREGDPAKPNRHRHLTARNILIWRHLYTKKLETKHIYLDTYMTKKTSFFGHIYDKKVLFGHKNNYLEMYL